jgi:hypothetical protein
VFAVVVSFIVVFCVLCFCLNVWLIRVMCVTTLLWPAVVLLPPGSNPIEVKYIYIVTSHNSGLPFQDTLNAYRPVLISGELLEIQIYNASFQILK